MRLAMGNLSQQGIDHAIETMDMHVQESRAAGAELPAYRRLLPPPIDALRLVRLAFRALPLVPVDLPCCRPSMRSVCLAKAHRLDPTQDNQEDFAVKNHVLMDTASGDAARIRGADVVIGRHVRGRTADEENVRDPVAETEIDELLHGGCRGQSAPRAARWGKHILYTRPMAPMISNVAPGL